jgi:hypothetical protein
MKTNTIGRTDNADGSTHIALFERCNNLSQCDDSLVSNCRRENWVRTGIYTKVRPADLHMRAKRRLGHCGYQYNGYQHPALGSAVGSVQS